MKRGLVFSLCAVALAGLASTASAQNVQVSLNLRYTDPADPSEGGVWYLVAKTDDTDGIAAISAYMSNISATGVAYGNGAGSGSSSYAATTAATIAAYLDDGNVPFVTTIGTAVNVVYGQNTSAGSAGPPVIPPGTIVADVGQGAGTPGNTPVDPLRNTAWNNAAIIATGTFAGGGAAGNQFNRPAFVASGANSTDANTLAGTTLGVASPDAVIQGSTIVVGGSAPVVRGDSLISFGLNGNAAAGLRGGDANRSFNVDIADFSILSNNFNQAGPKTWDQGDFNDSGVVDIADFSILSNNFNQSSPAPISAIPEPASLVLLAMGILFAGRCVKRS